MTTASLGFGAFGGPTLAASGASSLFGNQVSSVTTTAMPALGGLGGIGPSSSTTTTTQVPTVTPLWGGLGGSDKSPVRSGLGNTSGSRANEIKTVKENVVPPEILATVEEFSKHIKSQKLVRENIARMTARPLFKVEDDLKDLRQQLNYVTKMLRMNSTGVEKLKKEVTQELNHVEIAQRTKETPAGLQYENVQPAEYFQRIVDDFEKQMALYRQQFLEAERFFSSINQKPAADPSELMMVFAKLNDSFIFLAAKLQDIHEAVKSLKENYSQLQKRQYCDASGIFRRSQQEGRSTIQNSSVLNSTSPLNGVTTLGPSPFSCGNSITSAAFNSVLNHTIRPASAASVLPQQNPALQVGFFSQHLQQQPQQHQPFQQQQQPFQQQLQPFQQQLQPQQQLGGFGNAPSLFGGSAIGSGFNQSTSAASVGVGTMLQKPGNKRGKNS